MLDMPHFIQLHILTTYGPANLNRDDLGRPKTVVVGGVNRMRISSQSIKRAWRLSDAFQSALASKLGERTRRAGDKILEALRQVSSEHDAEAKAVASSMARTFGHLDEGAGKLPGNKQLSFITRDELGKAIELASSAFLVVLKKKESDDEDKAQQAIIELSKEFINAKDAKGVAAAAKKANGKDWSPEKGLKPVAKRVLNCTDHAVDVGMFGRMLAEAPEYNREAAVQVSHSFTTHEVRTEDDYYTAVDDLKAMREDIEDAGAGFVGVAHFGSGVFYTYVCIDTHLLLSNLNGDASVAQAALAALLTAACITSPSGKQASFASRAYASYAMVERGNAQGRQLSAAFIHPVRGDAPGGVLAESIARLERTRDRMANAYQGVVPDTDFRVMNAETGDGSLSDLIAFVKESLA